MPQLEEAQIGAADARTARAFATSWNNLPAGSVYTRAQFEDWIADGRSPGTRKMPCRSGSTVL